MSQTQHPTDLQGGYTLINASTSDSILAIDLGKYKSVACLYDPVTAEG